MSMRLRRADLAPALLVAVLLATPPVHGAAQGRCAPTAPDALGPFYTPDAPERARTGRGFTVSGTVRSADTCAPVPRARLEWWSANPRGAYDDAHRATQIADAEGRFTYETDLPGKYPGRPVHLHVKVSAPGHTTLVTQLYPKAGQSAMASDLVLRKN